MSTTTCGACEDQGFYLDRRCKEKVCAHPGATYPMDCPERPCKCKAGAPYRKVMRARIDKQNEWLDNALPFDRDYSHTLFETPEVEEVAEAVEASAEVA